METVSLLSWSLEHVRIKGVEPISFKDYPFQPAIYESLDRSQKVVVAKSAQSGGTLIGAAESLYLPDRRGLDVIYYFPSDGPARLMVKEKVNPMILADPYLRDRVYDPDEGKDAKTQSVHVKRIGQHFAYYRGAGSENNRHSTPADAVYLDEFDRFDPDWIPDIEKRLNASSAKLWREICVPTNVGWGIDRSYGESDQRAWMVRCDHCKNIQDIDWFRDVVVQASEHDWRLRDSGWNEGEPRDPFVYCTSCARPIDRLGAGRWVAKFPNRTTHGYHIHRLMTRTASVREIWLKFSGAMASGDQTIIAGVYNGDLGKAYTPEASGLTDDLLNRCKRRYMMPAKLLDRSDILTGGFDVQGDYLVGRISRILQREGRRTRQAVWIGRTTWNDLDALFERFVGLRFVVMDGAYDPTKAKEARARHAFLWLASYPELAPNSDWLVPDKGDRWVKIERTQAFDRSHAELVLERNNLPSNADKLPHFYAEMRSAVRVEEDTPKGKRFRWRKGTDPDDYRHADLYDFVAAELLDRGLAATPAFVAGESKREAAMERIRPRHAPTLEDLRRQRSST